MPVYSPATVLTPTDPGTQRLLASEVRTAAGSGSAVLLSADPRRYVTFGLFVTSVVNGGVGNFLRVWVQQSPDGLNWDDLAAFPEHTGSDPLLAYATVPVWEADAGGEAHAATDGSLSLGTVRSTGLGRCFRVVWQYGTTSGGTEYTFEVWAFPR